VEAVRAAADVAIGSRYVRGYAPRGQPLWRRAWSRLANGVSRARWVRDVRDIHTGYKAFTGSAAQALFSRSSLSGWAFDLEVLGLAQRAGLNIVEVGIRWSDDADSRVRPWRDLRRVLREARRLDERLRGDG
jgi:dolichyl-phosphate beta-glucosyltransferase